MLDLNVRGGGTTLSPSPLSLSLSKTHFLTMCEFMLDLNDTGGVRRMVRLCAPKVPI